MGKKMRRSRRSTYQIHDVMLAVAFTAIGIAWVQAPPCHSADY